MRVKMLAILLLGLTATLSWGQGAKPDALTEVEHLRVLVEQLRDERNRLDVIRSRDRAELMKALQQARAEVERLKKALAEPKPSEP